MSRQFYLFSAVIFFTFTICECGKPRNFELNREKGSFMLDGKPFRYISGSIHNFRVPSAYWNDRFRKTRAAGFNAVQIYVDWSRHEPLEGAFNFDGENDLELFVQLAQDNDLFVILRPGPFIDAERDMGGLPFWLLQKNPDVKLRTNDPNFMVYVDRWLQILFGKLSKYLIENGGPIIMVQVENEYGSYVQQKNFYDIEYVTNLRELTRLYLNSSKVVLFSVDGCGPEYLRDGKIPGVYSAVDFGSEDDGSECFAYQRLFEPQGPFINPEFYTGWLDHWSEPHQVVDSNLFAKSLDKVLAQGANINMYMIIGGTSFGFEAGANDPPFRPSPTSYDYDAPISEAGDLREKYFAIKEVIKKYLPIPQIEVNNQTEKGNYGKVILNPVSSLINEPHMFTDVKASSLYPMTFEAIGQAHGFVLYETMIDKIFSDPAKLEVTGIHDRGYVFVDGKPQGILSRMYYVDSLPVQARPQQLLQIMVENQGRICYGPNNNDFKGIVSNVTIGGKLITNWKMNGISMADGKKLTTVLKEKRLKLEKNLGALNKLSTYLAQTGGSMSFWTGTFEIPCDEEPKDTFAQFNGWHKGVLFVNGFNVGRYWPTEGPQQTLYVPATFLNGNCQPNEIVLFEQDRAECLSRKQQQGGCNVQFVTVPVIDGTTPVQ